MDLCISMRAPVCVPSALTTRFTSLRNVSPSHANVGWGVMERRTCALMTA